jgi:uroporphyrinogen III methyltransferase / synthase
MSDNSYLGKVYLVGAGPGDPRLITVRAIECLRQANVILYDYLVNPELLSYAPCSAKQVRLEHHTNADTINRRMIDDARRGSPA